MGEEDIFLLDILARPDDDVPRLVYADWLEDHGDPRAAYVRIGWELRGGLARAAARKDFQKHLAEVCRENDWASHDGLVLTWTQFLVVFRVRLAEVIALWVGNDPKLRTPELDPQALVGLFTPYGWPDDPNLDWPGMVIQLAIDRRRLLDRRGRLPTRLPSSLMGGRLVFCDPQATLNDGQASRYSGDYFDRVNLPPWDTWILQAPEPSPLPRGNPPIYSPNYLVAWVPGTHLARAQVGIDVNEERCICWLDQMGTPLAGRLREAGLSR